MDNILLIGQTICATLCIIYGIKLWKIRNIPNTLSEAFDYFMIISVVSYIHIVLFMLYVLRYT